MDYIKDITLGEFANLSYIDLPEDFNKDLKKDIEIPLSDFADSCIGYYLDKEKKWGNILSRAGYFKYIKTRSSSCPKEFLKEFYGFLQTDGYTG